MAIEINQRVGAIASLHDDTAELFGYGVYEGFKVPHTDDVMFYEISLKQRGLTNPCILLDSGERVYGCECWWGEEDKVREMLTKYGTIKMITPKEYRKENVQANKL